MKKAMLRLSDGTTFEGYSFGADVSVSGEVVFNTAMVGYPESLTDPSYAGQLMTLTFPLVGNYGVPELTFRSDGLATYMESERIYARAIICCEYSGKFSHWNAHETLAQWLKREGVPGITGVDTRALAMLLREHGVMMGSIEIEGCEHAEQSRYEDVNFVAQVSCKEVMRYNVGGAKKVVLVDCGVKHNIIRCLIDRGLEVVRVPWDYEFGQIDADGLFLSNGPGNPENCMPLVHHIRNYMQTGKPIFGICMGNQLLGKAAGAAIYKLPYGHRSHNQPVRLVGENRCFITSQNHGYALDADTLPEGWMPLFENMNDGSNEGIRHVSKPWFSVQFHPEACSGPVDTEFLFDDFVKLLNQ